MTYYIIFKNSSINNEEMEDVTIDAPNDLNCPLLPMRNSSLA
jgi:hypothetical protein